MFPRIGKKYEETKKKLKILIREGITPLEIEAENHACYFCGKSIEDKVYVLEISEPNKESKYYLDEDCYNQAKQPTNRMRNYYLN